MPEKNTHYVNCKESQLDLVCDTFLLSEVSSVWHLQAAHVSTSPWWSAKLYSISVDSHSSQKKLISPMWLMQKHPYKICTCSWHGHLETYVITKLFSRKHLGWNYELGSTTNVPYKPVCLTARSPVYSSLSSWEQTVRQCSAIHLIPGCCPTDLWSWLVFFVQKTVVLLDEFHSSYFAVQGTLHFFPCFLFCKNLCSHILREGDYSPLCRVQPEFRSVARAWSLALSPVPSVCFSCFTWSTFSM